MSDILAWVVLVTILVGVAACTSDAGIDGLPEVVAGEQLVYDLNHGTAGSTWAQEVATQLGAAEDDVVWATGFTSPGPREYQSYVLRIRGREGDDFVVALVEAVAGPLIHARIEEATIRGKGLTVVTFDDFPDDPVYAYTFADTAVLFRVMQDVDLVDVLDQLP